MFKLLTRAFLLMVGMALVTGAAAAQDDTYEDPQGRFSVPIPVNWTAEETEHYVVLKSPEGTIKFYFLVQPLEGSAREVIDAAWMLVNPDFAAEESSTLEPPSQPPVDAILDVNYKRGEDDLIYEAVAQTVGDQVYLLLFEGELTAIQRRQAQIGIIGSGYKITGTPEKDLTGVEPRQVDAEITDALEAYINQLMPVFKIPGVVVAVVQDGQIVYSNAFGVRELGQDAPMTVDTHMMIGSSGKSLTTTMMASEIDDGLMTWDTPVVDILPQFKMADPDLTQRITVKNLVCACTGVPRRDFEWLFNANHMSAEDIVQSLSTFEVFTDFGEAFQYSNQMVATGGYVAAAAAGGSWGNLMDTYTAELQSRVLDPVGMTLTTVSFDAVKQRGQYATPHALKPGLEYAPLPLDAEEVLSPVTPAGAHWSTVEDMARYLIMQLNKGVTADGTRIVSEANLLVTRQPQVAVSAGASYGLGWFVETYKGLPLIEHGGNTFGFTSDVAFLPDAGLGVVVLTNARASNLFNSAVRTRLFDLVYDDVDASPNDDMMTFAAEYLSSLLALPETMQDHVDTDVVEAYTGTYTSDILGDLTISLEDARLYFDVGEFRSEVLPVMKEDAPDVIDAYVLIDPPVSRIKVQFVETDGAVNVILGEGLAEYSFTPVP